jgi:hypothetical protein
MAEDFKVSALSTEYVRAAVRATSSTGIVNPTTGTAEFAFLSNSSAPASADWKSGSWETINGTYYARSLIGPSGVQTFTAGIQYQVWARITLSPETVVERLGTLVAY